MSAEQVSIALSRMPLPARLRTRAAYADGLGELARYARELIDTPDEKTGPIQAGMLLTRFDRMFGVGLLHLTDEDSLLVQEDSEAKILRILQVKQDLSPKARIPDLEAVRQELRRRLIAHGRGDAVSDELLDALLRRAFDQADREAYARPWSDIETVLDLCPESEEQLGPIESGDERADRILGILGRHGQKREVDGDIVWRGAWASEMHIGEFQPAEPSTPFGGPWIWGVRDLVARLVERAGIEDSVATVLGEIAEHLETFECLLNDFIGADLSEVDLEGISLDGVRWSSSTTRWPIDWQERIELDSVLVEGEDIFEIRYGTRASTALV
ncbi:hypothetical protein [Nocardia asiatica]|uniref:hypothetical protein n=1 Tax=Nocardia asiatica TaxID=209252 RepID=UPI003EE2F05B